MKTKESPVSFRPGKERAEAIAEYGRKHGYGPTRALHELIDAGLAADAPKAVPTGLQVGRPGAKLADPEQTRDRWSTFRPAKAAK